MNISYLSKCGLVKYEGSFIFPISSKLEDIKIHLMEIDEISYLVVQKKYVSTDKMSGSYSSQTDQYYYQIFEVNYCHQLSDVHNIIRNIEVEQTVHTLEHIKQYIKER